RYDAPRSRRVAEPRVTDDTPRGSLMRQMSPAGGSTAIIGRFSRWIHPQETQLAQRPPRTELLPRRRQQRGARAEAPVLTSLRGTHGRGLAPPGRLWRLGEQAAGGTDSDDDDHGNDHRLAAQLRGHPAADRAAHD